MNDRRAIGLRKTITTDGNGGTIEVYHFSMKKVQTWIGILIGMATIATIIFGAVRFGIGVEAREILEQEAVEEHGIIHSEMHECATEVVNAAAARLEKEINELDKQVSANTALNTRLEERQIAMEKKADEQHRETLHAISELRRSN